MKKWLLLILRRVFKKEEGKVVEWCRRHKGATLIFILFFPLLLLYYSNPVAVNSILIKMNMFFTAYGLYVLLLWNIILTIYIFFKRDSDNIKFDEDFRKGLKNWMYTGDWKIEDEDGGKVLIVRNSEIGGYAKPCILWNDYSFEFETKIVQANSSWLIRASDNINYVMLQCTTDAINPHLRIHGAWILFKSSKLPVKLKRLEWFRIRIKVKGSRIVVSKIEGDKEINLYDEHLIEPKRIRATFEKDGNPEGVDIFPSFPLGSIGFRECGTDECAHFRNISVRKIR